jgi:hypothetical protein
MTVNILLTEADLIRFSEGTSNIILCVSWRVGWRVNCRNNYSPNEQVVSIACANVVVSDHCTVFFELFYRSAMVRSKSVIVPDCRIPDGTCTCFDATLRHIQVTVNSRVRLLRIILLSGSAIVDL